MFELIRPFAIALIIGFVIGIERERYGRDQLKTMGVRTFSIIAILGALAGYWRELPLTIAILGAIGALILVGYLRETDHRYITNGKAMDLGLTSELAALMVFSLGLLTWSQPLLSVILGLVLTILLYSRQILHYFSTQVIRPAEISAGLTLAAIILILMPLLPDVTIDPWGLLNPRRLCQIISTIASIEFGSYLIQRVTNQKIGAWASGFFGGLASSTLVFLSSARGSKEAQFSLHLVQVNLFAALVSTLSLYLLVIISAAKFALLQSVLLPVACGILLAFFWGYHSLCKTAADTGTVGFDLEVQPLKMLKVLKLSAAIIGLLMLVGFVQKFFGHDASIAVSLLGGLFELQAIAYANASLFAQGALQESEASTNLMVAFSASFFSKILILWVFGERRLAFPMTMKCLTIVGLAFAAFYLQGLLTTP